MGQYNKAILTAAGENLIARTLAGEIQLNITKAKTSNYIYPAGTDFKSLTDIQGIKQTATDPATAVYNDTMIQTRVLFSNEEIVSTYYIHNIGLYAMDGTQEVLFCIVTAETPDEMPQYNGVASTSYIYNIQNVIQDASELHITVNSSGTATIQDVLERVDATGGDISETVIETLDTVEDKYPIPTAGESVKRFFGKVLTFLRNIRPLTGDITLYVATTGSDVTGDGSSAKPFKTIQHTVDILPKDLNGYSAIINVAAGTYAEDLYIVGFVGGSLNLYSDTKDTLANTCKVSSITMSKFGAGYLRVNGFNFTTTLREAIVVTGCNGVHIRCCQITGATSTWTGAQVNESFCNFGVCKVVNRKHGVSYSNSTGTSVDWDTGSTGNSVGISSYSGARITVVGVQPVGTTNYAVGDGGAFVYYNGTQINGMINSGLSCTWGNIVGGYARHGNLSGVAMVTITLSISLTSALSAGGTYYIYGFPRVFGGSVVAVSVHDKKDIYYCQINHDGALQMYVLNTLTAGNTWLAFNCTYITDQ